MCIQKILILLSILLLFGCYNKTTVNLAVKSCNYPFEQVNETIPTLKNKNATLYLQIKEEDIGNEQLNNVINTIKQNELKFIVWPLLKEEQGPWANEHNYNIFSELVYKVMDYLEEMGVKPEYVVVNMENSASQMNAIKSYVKDKKYREAIELLMTNMNSDLFNRGVQGYKELVDMLHSKGYKVMITTYPFMIDDFKDGDPDIQDLANVPISGIDWDAYTFTPYRTAYSGDFSVTFTPYIVYEYANAAKDLFKEKARIALGIIGDSEHGTGFTSPEDLDKDVAAAKAANISEVDLFHLGGMEKNGGVAIWLNAGVEAKIPDIDLKVIAARAFVRSLDKILSDKYDEGKMNKIIDMLDSLKINK